MDLLMQIPSSSSSIHTEADSNQFGGTLGEVLYTYEQEGFEYPKLQFIYIVIMVVTLVFQIIAGVLVYKVYKLLKFSDIPQLSSVLCIMLSLTCILAWSILNYFFFFHSELVEILDRKDLLRLLSFLALMFFGVAVIFDLYKWTSFVVATGTYISQRTDLYLSRMKLLKKGVISAQLFLLLSVVVFSVMYLSTDLLTTDESEKQFIANVRLADRYFGAVLFLTIAIALAVVDVLLLKRLKMFYPAFYKQERCKVAFSNLSLIVALLMRVASNYVMTQDWYFKLLVTSMINKGWFFPMHQFLVLAIGFYLPMSAIGYSLAYAFSQKRRVHTRRMNSNREAINNRSTVPSFLEEDAEKQQDKSGDTEALLYDELGMRRSEINQNGGGDSNGGQEINEYDALLEFWHEGQLFKMKENRISTEDNALRVWSLGNANQQVFKIQKPKNTEGGDGKARRKVKGSWAGRKGDKNPQESSCGQDMSRETGAFWKGTDNKQNKNNYIAKTSSDVSFEEESKSALSDNNSSYM